MPLPKLSVLLPNYNHAQFVGHALQAMLAQTVQPLEIIVIDDGSSDNSLQVLETFARRHAHIRLLRNDTNRGVNYTLNRALKEARGEYIYGAAADDQVLPGFFERSLRLLASHPQAGLCCSFPSRIDSITGTVTQHALPWSRHECFLSPQDLAAVMRGYAVPGHASIARRDALLEVGGWNARLQWYTDWYALQVIAFRRGVCFIPATMALFRSSLASFYSTGVRNWELQSQAVEHLLQRLQSPECRDVVGLFRKSGVMHEIGLDAVRVLALRPELRTPLVLELLRPSILKGAGRLLRDRNRQIRAGAAALIGEFGAAGWKSLPRLVAARNDSDPAVRLAVAVATGHVFGSEDRPGKRLAARTVVSALEAGHYVLGHLKVAVRPAAAWLFQALHSRLYGRVDHLEADFVECSSSFDKQREQLWRELQAFREGLDAQATDQRDRPSRAA